MNEIPKTIEELQRVYIDKNLPREEVTRFFIGKDYKHPKAFGIYKDEMSGNFIVYKNKADGTRAIRYNGPDEAFAVKELYLRLEEEIINQREHRNNRTSYNRRPATPTAASTLTGIVFIAIFIVFFVFCMIFGIASPKRGYYLYSNVYYYYQNGKWYDYHYGWSREFDAPSELTKNHKEYYLSKNYYYTYDTTNFEYTSYYEEPTTSSSSSSSSSSWDSGSSWDSSDSWDSSSTDWDSDW